ncbi:MAG: cbb3-type cytochrome c oxidase subunit I [Acidimicrobiaceae bacterium]|nr:cbb3-type cytochrome c oxidase subunit I [Acidimicrobiaceae bacterium]
MTMTDSATATGTLPSDPESLVSPTSAASAASAPSVSFESPVASEVGGVFDALTTTDHKRIGRLWLRSSLLMLLAVAVVGVLLRIEDINSSPDDIFAGTNNYFQFFGLYRLGMVLLVVLPLFVGLATVVVPMQVGATNIAFPRAAHGAAWLFMIGAGITVVAVLAGGGWGALDGVSPSEADAIALTLVGTALLIGAILVASVCVATTVVSLRTPGMNLLRVPLFAWSMLVAAAVWLLTLPLALGNLVLIYFDLRGGPGEFGNIEGSDAVFAQLGWLIEQPQIYALAIPVLGVFGQVAAVVAKRRHAQHAAAMALIGFFGLLSVGGWSQPWFQGDSHDEQFVFVVFGLSVALPVLGSVAAVAATFARPGADAAAALEPSLASLERTKKLNLAGLLSVHGLAAFAAVLVLLAATVAGLVRVVQPWDLGGRTTVTAVMNLVWFAALLAGIAGIWFWAPKIAGVLLPGGLGRSAIFNIALGAVLLGGADFVSGFFGAGALAYQYSAASVSLVSVPSNENLVEVMNACAAVGALLIVLGVLAVVAAWLKPQGNTETLSDNPFGGLTLEWATPSPPPLGNFLDAPARVVSEVPLLDSVNDTEDDTEDDTEEDS